MACLGRSIGRVLGPSRDVSHRRHRALIGLQREGVADVALATLVSSTPSWGRRPGSTCALLAETVDADA
jgi:hypothetical protein